MASPTQWTWVWVDSGYWWWTVMPGMLRFMGSQRVGHDWVTELNWTEPSVYTGVLVCWRDGSESCLVETDNESRFHVETGLPRNYMSKACLFPVDQLWALKYKVNHNCWGGQPREKTILESPLSSTRENLGGGDSETGNSRIWKLMWNRSQAHRGNQKSPSCTLLHLLSSAFRVRKQTEQEGKIKSLEQGC